MAGESWVVTMPKLGETVSEGTIGSWLKNVGDTVAFDDPLFEVSSDKVDSEFPSPYDGVILEIMVGEGETVPVGTEIVRIGEPGSVPGDSSAAPAPAQEPAAAAPAAESGGESADELHDITMPKLGETVSEGTIGLWLKNIGDTVAFDDPLFEVSTDKVDAEFPSPYDGVLVEILVQADEIVPIGTVLARIGEPGAKASVSGAAAAAPAAAGPTAVAAGSSVAPLAAGGCSGKLYSPIVRRLAAENNIDLSTVTGTGAGGRIRREDIEAAIARGPVAAPVQSAPSAQPGAAPATAAGGDPRDEVVKLSRMRLAVGAGMIHSLQSAAQVWTSVEVDYENVEQMRRKHKEAFKAQTGASLSYLPFAARAVCEVLLKIPPVNASIDFEKKTQTLHPYVNLGIAVDMDEDGLIVPVIKNADQLNLRGLAQQIKQKAEDGRNKVLPSEDMKGSTFTITNPGRTFASGPVINQPNVAIVATEGVSRKPVAVGDAIAIHHVGVISLVYDHRAFDGVVATRFLLAIKDIIENRDWETELG